MKYIQILTISFSTFILGQCAGMKKQYAADFPMHRAAGDGDSIAVRNYLKQGQFIDSRDRWGRTPLHLAAAEGRQNLVLYLLKNGANPTAKDENGFTPSGHAKHSKQYGTMNLILAKGGNSEYDMRHKKESNEEGLRQMQESLQNAARAWSF